MREISYYISKVRRQVLKQTICRQSINTINRIEPLSAADTYDPQTIYLADAGDQGEMERLKSISTTIAVFISCADGQVPNVPISSYVYACFVQMKPMELYWVMNSVLRVKKTISGARGVSAANAQNAWIALNFIAAQMSVSVYILNEGYRLLCSGASDAVESKVGEKLTERGYLPPDLVKNIINPSLEKDGYSVVRFGGLVYYAFFNQCTSAATVVLFVAKRAMLVELQYLNNCLTELLQAGELRVGSPDNVLRYDAVDEQYLVGRLIDGTISDPLAIQYLFGNLEDTHFTVVWVRFADAFREEKQVALLHDMRPLFHALYGTVYKGELICIATIPIPEKKELYSSKDYRKWLFVEEKAPEKLEVLLKQYGARAGIATPCTNFSNIGYVYASMEEPFSFALRMGEKDRRLFFTEEYNIYRLISYGLDYFSKREMQENYGILLHPDIANIIKHDHNREDDLSEVLLSYLMLGGDIQRISEAMHVHRNTIYKKLRKIEEVLKVSVTDPNFMLQASFSLLIHKYAKEILELDASKTFVSRKRSYSKSMIDQSGSV